MPGPFTVFTYGDPGAINVSAPPKITKVQSKLLTNGLIFTSGPPPTSSGGAYTFVA
jgi:hypothetical protein